MELLENMIGDVRVHVEDERPWRLRLEDYIRVPLNDVLKVSSKLLHANLFLTSINLQLRCSTQ